MHRANELEEELTNYSVKIVKFARKIEKDIPKSIANQLVRSATSIGANYTEAINGSSKADFKNKIFIAKKEASETKYWLNIIKELCDESVDELLSETQNYIMILQKTINTLNGRKR